MTTIRGKWMQVIGSAALVWAASAGAAARQAQAPPAAPPGGGAMTVLAGVFTDEQAKRGEAVAAKLCTGCHGPDLAGGEAGPALVGPEFLGAWTTLTLGDFYDRVHSTMPADSPGTMTPQQVSDVTAYVLKLNKYPAGKTELATELAALKGIKIEGAAPAK